MFPIMMHGSITGTAEISGLCVKINENTGIITDNITPLTNPAVNVYNYEYKINEGT